MITKMLNLLRASPEVRLEAPNEPANIQAALVANAPVTNFPAPVVTPRPVLAESPPPGKLALDPSPARPARRATEADLQTVARLSGCQLITAEELSNLKAIEEQICRLNKFIEQYSTLAASDRFSQQAHMLAEHVARGGDPGEIPTRTRDEIGADCKQKRQAIEQTKLQLSQSTRPVIEQVVARYADAAERVAYALEDADRALAAKFGCIYEPSNSAAFVRSTVSLARQNARLEPEGLIECAVAPTSLLAGLLQPESESPTKNW